MQSFGAKFFLVFTCSEDLPHFLRHYVTITVMLFSLLLLKLLLLLLLMRNEYLHRMLYKPFYLY